MAQTENLFTMHVSRLGHGAPATDTAPVHGLAGDLSSNCCWSWARRGQVSLLVSSPLAP